MGIRVFFLVLLLCSASKFDVLDFFIGYLAFSSSFGLIGRPLSSYHPLKDNQVFLSCAKGIPSYRGACLDFKGKCLCQL